MTFDLDGLPDELKEYIQDALALRSSALMSCEKEIKELLQECVYEIRQNIGRGIFKGIGKDLAQVIEEQKIIFASELETVLQKGLTTASYAGLGIGASIEAGRNIFAAHFIDDDVIKQAELIVKSTFHKRRVFNGKPFILSDRIWDISGNNIDKIKEIIESGVNTDCIEVAKALEQYIKKGAATLSKDYPDMMKRMGRRVPKNLSYEAVRLARNELSEVYWQSTIERYKDNPGIKAAKWVLSNNRIEGHDCECELLAYEDRHGLGAGIYPVDDVPNRPHVNCLCHTVPLIDRVVKSGEAVNIPPKDWEETQKHLYNTKNKQFTDKKELDAWQGKKEKEKEAERKKRRKAYKKKMEALTDAEKEALREKRREYYRKKKAEKDTRNKELEEKLKTLYDKPTEYRDVYIERYGAKVNKHKQNRHIYEHESVTKEASYFKNDIKTLQKVIDEKAGTGEVTLKNGQLREIIEDARLKGFDVDKNGLRKPIATDRAKIHYSHTGTHLVPCAKKEE